MSIIIPQNPKITEIPNAISKLKSISLNPNNLVTKEILLKSNFNQFIFLIGLTSYDGKNFNNNLLYIKFYIKNVIKDNLNLLLQLEIILHQIFLKKYETEEAYDKFYTYISSLYKTKKNKVGYANTVKIDNILFYVPSPVLLAHTNPLFYMLLNRKDYSSHIVIASNGSNNEFERKCMEVNVEYINIKRRTLLETLNNLGNLSKEFDIVIWQSLPVHLSYFRTLNQKVCLWSHKFHPNIDGLMNYVGSFNEEKKIIYFNKNYWKNIDVGFEIKNRNTNLQSWEKRKLNFGSFCREELINEKQFWEVVKIILEDNIGSKFFYCGRESIHDYWCRNMGINKNNVVYLGWLDEPHLKLKDMAFLVDGFRLGHGYMALEAMAACVPIIFPKNRQSYGTLENYVNKTAHYFCNKYKDIHKYKNKYLLSFESEDQLKKISKKLFYNKNFNQFYGSHYASIISKLRNDTFEKFINVIGNKKM